MRGRLAPAALGLAALSLQLAPAHAAPIQSSTNPVRPGSPFQRDKAGLETVQDLPVRSHVTVTWDRAPQGRAVAWSRFLSTAGIDWRASWDDGTRVPSRIFGRGIPAPGAVANPRTAELHARSFLADHIDLLAPGSRPDDFALVSNQLRRGMRTLGFVQRAGGIPVIGGQLSFRYKNDRLFVMSSQALPDVPVPRSAATASREAARSFARSWVLAGAAAEASSGSVTGPFILPIVGRSSVLDYRLVHRVEVDARQPVGLYHVYTDAMTGAPVAREQKLSFGEGLVRFNVPVRHPGDGRELFPARSARFTVAGSDAISSTTGIVSWAGDSSVSVTLRAEGPLVRVANQSGDQATDTRTIAPGSAISWAALDDEAIDAQLTAYIHADLVKDYARSFAGDLAWLDEQLPVNVNIDSECNAFSDGNSINFFQSNGQCANTALLADVVYHEFGHSLHSNSIQAGVGSFDGAHSEGLSDYLAATITGDPGMGRGFFHDDNPLRHIDPLDREHIWPRDVAEIHYTGLIFAGAMWDLRKLLIEQYGEADGVALADKLFYATLLRATDIPSTYIEVLAEDDDDGDLFNGTPNLCDINAAFGAHGLRALSAELEPLAAELPGEDGFPVTMRVTGLSAQCPGDGLAGATLDWYLRNTHIDSAEQIAMVQSDDDPSVWTATIPPAAQGNVVLFKILVDFVDGTFRGFPSNPADPRYQFYVGEVVPLYCTDFETNPFDEGWTHALAAGNPEEGADDWGWGAPMAPAQSGDPAAAFSGDSVIGNDLGGTSANGNPFNGKYQPDKVNYAQTPRIDVGQYSDVRIQYWRWLNVEDAFFDQATIYANNQVAWRNFNSDNGDQSAIQHTDREWRFQDVPVSDFINDGTVDVRFEIASDGGLEFGGWTIDDFCVVAAAGSICGDGVVSGAETCDDGDGNSNEDPGACRDNCRLAACGDGVVDDGEFCDDGNTADGDGCNALCTGRDNETGDCGCQIAPRRGGPGAGPLLLMGLTILALLAPRIRRRRRSSHM